MGTYRTLLLLTIAVGSKAAAQSGGSIAVNAGNATDVTGAGSSAVTIAPSFTRASALSASTLSATATKFANDAWSAGLGVVMTGRAHDRAMSPAIDVALSAATTSYDFAYATADLIPSIEAKAGRTKLFAGARLSAAGASSILPTAGSMPVGPLPTADRATTSATARTLIAGASLTSVAASGAITSLGYRGESGIVASERQTDHTASASVANSKAMLAGAVGRRMRMSHATSYGSATLGVAMTPTVMVQFSAGSYAANPMLGTAAGRFVNAGLSMRLGRRAGALPAPAGVRAPGPGMTRVSIKADDARRVELAGDFNQWKPVVASRAENGVWYADLDLPQGEYRYAFRIDGKEWRVPEGVAAVDDEFGGKSAWLTVSRPTSK